MNSVGEEVVHAQAVMKDLLLKRVATCVPPLYPNATLHSIVAHYHARSGNIFERDSLQDLFGANVFTATNFPTRLQNFATRLSGPAKIEPENLIRDHTALPYYQAFISQEKWLRATSAMLYAGRPRINMGVHAHIVKECDALKYCEMCCREQKNEWGACYWVRSHQLPGVNVCPFHKVRLIKSTVRTKAGFSTGLRLVLPCPHIKPESSIRSGGSIKVQVTENECRFALMSDALFHLGIVQDEKLRASCYRQALELSGYGSFHRLMLERLARDLDSFWGKEVTEGLNIQIGDEKHAWWLRYFFQRSKELPPALHLLLIGFLWKDIPDFLDAYDHASIRAPQNREAKLKPPERPPWIALLPELMIQFDGCQKSIANSLGVAERTINEQIERSGLQRARGHYTEFRMRHKLIEQDLLTDMPLEAIAAKHELHIRSVYSHLIASPKARQHRDALTQKRHEELRRAQRKMWEACRTESPSASRTELRRSHPALYAWLYHQDRPWFQKHLPPNRARRSSPVQKKNWDQFDTDMAEQIRRAAAELICLPGKPRRASCAAITRRLGVCSDSLVRNRNLPKVHKALAESVETVVNCQYRRYLWAVSELRKAGIPSSYSYAMLKGGIPMSARDQVKKWEHDLESS